MVVRGWGMHKAYARRRFAHGQALTVLCGLVLVGTLSVYSAQVLAEVRIHAAWGDIGSVAEMVLFLAVLYMFALGGLAYMIIRVGWLRREQAFRHTPREEVQRDLFGGGDAPSVLFLVPSYKEERGVVWRTLLSAALQEYPNRRVVLLIDDPPDSVDPRDQRALLRARRLAGEVRALLATPAAHVDRACAGYAARLRKGTLDETHETRCLARLNEYVAGWFSDCAAQEPVYDHMSRFFARDLLAGRADEAQRQADTLWERLERSDPLPADAVRREYRRLACLFRVEVTHFERKRYANLSHAPNKAMNLNSYLGLVGGAFVEERREGAPVLVAAPREDAGLVVPDTEMVVILDADSLVLGHYAQTLVDVLKRPENADIAVAQTPYRSFSGHATLLERSAAATTDVMYFGHVGFTHFNAGFMVGASTMIRMEALRQVSRETTEGGHPIVRFLHDRTMIEDAETSVDLICQGWRIYNHPARLSWSATPPDFGALVIQRRRWANGGLILWPKLLRYVIWRAWRPRELIGASVSTQYLAAGALVNLGMLTMLVYPFESIPWSLWGPLAAVPYFFLYGRDLTLVGYRWRDLARAYALNLLLIPVVIAGTLRSLEQIATGRRAPFARTPKVRGRTGAPALYVAFVLGLVLYLAGMVGVDLARGRWVHLAFSGFNGAMLLYALTCLMDPAAALEDLLGPVTAPLVWLLPRATREPVAAPGHLVP